MKTSINMFVIVLFIVCASGFVEGCNYGWSRPIKVPQVVNIQPTTTKSPPQKPTMELITSSRNYTFNDVLEFKCNTSYVGDVKLEINMHFVTKLGKVFKIAGICDSNWSKDGTYKEYHLCKATYNMDFEEDSVELKCEARDNNGAVVAHQSMELYRIFPPRTTTTTTSISSADDTGISSDMSTYTGEDNESSGSSSKLYMWVMAGVGIIIIIILLTISVKVCKSKKSRMERDRDDVTYENLSNETAYPPFPKTATLEETYLKPSDCRETDSVTYAQPYVERNIEDMYSKPLPKLLRNQTPLYSEITPNTKSSQSEPTYAEIENLSNNGKEPSKNNPPYATIMEVTQNNGSPNYTNVFNGRYVNSNKASNGDYVEPSYCEIGNLINHK